MNNRYDTDFLIGVGLSMKMSIKTHARLLSPFAINY